MSREITASAPRLGSVAWLEESDGILTAKERLLMLPSVAGTFGRLSRDRLRLAVGARPRHAMSLAELWPIVPDSNLSRQAEEEARELQSASMLRHGYRTWLFGSAFAKIDSARLDGELFYASALVHDVGLERRHPGRCFTHRSAEAAGAAADRAAIDGDRKLEMMDGIAMHISPGLAYEDSPIGFYLQAGAMADLAGIRAWELPPDLRARADCEHPRHRIHEVLSRCWQAEARDVPGGRAHLADAYGGFSRVIRWLPVRAVPAS